MKVSDKELISLLEKSGPKTSNELFHILKKTYPQLDKNKVIKRLKTLRKKSHIRITKKGKIIPQVSIKQKESHLDLEIPENDFHEICRKYKYKNFFSKKQIEEAESVSKITSNDYKDRVDFRDQLLITIDGEDAKDLDDAVAVEKRITGYVLYVHIADVANYVKENTALDKEARKRGNSVYLVNRVIPMLPEKLSNGICSLNEGVDRLCMTAEIHLSRKGDIKKYFFHEGVIKVKKRYTYNRVQEILDNGKAIDSSDKPFVKMIKTMKELATALYKKRMKDGCLDFNLDEVKIICDDQSFPIEVVKRRRKMSSQIIEEFMLTANKVVAQYLNQKFKKAGVYRVHDNPDTEKLDSFNRFVQKFGYRLENPMKPDSLQLQKILQQVSGKEEEKVINIVLLRTMKQAVYSTENNGHFALAFHDYTHFTSPIRRYSDLLVHRLLKDAMGFSHDIKQAKQQKYLNDTTQHISQTERTAMDAEREIVKKKSARFMKDKVGETFNGTVSGVTAFGMFIELDPYGIEGMVRFIDLKGFFIYDEENYQIYRDDRKVVYKLGTKVKAILTKVEVKRNFIDLILVD